MTIWLHVVFINCVESFWLSGDSWKWLGSAQVGFRNDNFANASTVNLAGWVMYIQIHVHASAVMQLKCNPHDALNRIEFKWTKGFLFLKQIFIFVEFLKRIYAGPGKSMMVNELNCCTSLIIYYCFCITCMYLYICFIRGVSFSLNIVLFSYCMCLWVFLVMSARQKSGTITALMSISGKLFLLYIYQPPPPFIIRDVWGVHHIIIFRLVEKLKSRQKYFTKTS